MAEILGLLGRGAPSSTADTTRLKRSRPENHTCLTETLSSAVRFVNCSSSRLLTISSERYNLSLTSFAARERHGMGCMKVLTALVFGGLAVQIAHAQAVSGSITGLVTDTSGAVVAGAGITITNQETSVPSQVSTTDTGYYSVPNLIPGTYSVVAEAKGFKLFRVQQVTVNLNSIVRVDCVLEVGNISETVTVSAERHSLRQRKPTSVVSSRDVR